MKSFWRGRRVFLTGHTGFKGGWLSLWLNRLGASVVGYSLAPPTEPNLFSLAGIDTVVESHIGDVRDRDCLARALKQSGAEIVFHLAAQPLVREGYADPVGTFETNVMGTVNLLQAVRAVDSVRTVVNVTTDKCYRNDDSGKVFVESDALGGIEPYGASKACSEIASDAFAHAFFDAARHQEHGVVLATARAGNVIGGGDWARDRILPDIIRCFQSGEPVVVRHPESIRPWQHVLDPLAGYLRLARRMTVHGLQYGGAWNFGPSAVGLMPVSGIVDRCVEIWGAPARWVRDGRSHLPEAKQLHLESTRARRELNWQPRIPIDVALSSTLDWHRAVGADASMARRTCEAQIAAYPDEELA